MQTKYKLGDWLVDPSENTISKQNSSISIEPKAMSLLDLLCQANGAVVSRENIMLHIWKERYVTDYALNNLVSNLRKYLNAGSTTESYIKTRPKKGYQIIADLEPMQIAVTQILTDKTSDFVSSTEAEAESMPTASANKQSTGTKPITHSYLYSIIVFAICAIAYFGYFYQDKPAQALQKSIAVLPFEVYAEEDDLRFFADGLADEIIHQLNTLNDFKVISRRSSFSYQDKGVNTQKIAEDLGVVYIVEGSVRAEKDTFRTTVQLVNTIDESILWSRVFTASHNNSFSIQHEISTDIAKSMDTDFVSFPKESLRHPPVSSEAYLHVLRGRKLNQEGNAEAKLKARDEFLMATLLEPNYAMAYVNLAISYLLLEQGKMMDNDEASQLFTEAIDKAIAIDKDLAEAHAAYGIFYYNKYNFDLSKASFERALSLNPKLYIALINYANLLRAYYYPKESQILYLRAREIAPLSGPVHWGIANTSLALGQFDQAISSGQDCIKRNPLNTNCLMGLAYAYRLNMQSDKAEEVLKTLATKVSTEDYYYKLAIAWHSLQINKLEQADSILNDLLNKHGFNMPIQNMTYVQIGLNKEKEWLERLASIPNSRTKGLSFIANYANTAYFNDECALSIEYYQLMLNQQPNLANDISILSNGVTYLNNLAYCYVQEGNKVLAQNYLQQFNSIVSKLNPNLQKHPAILFAKTQHAILMDDVDLARSSLKRLNDTPWGLSWLIEKDPIIGKINDM